jgi:hypothetical protein
MYVRYMYCQDEYGTCTCSCGPKLGGLCIYMYKVGSLYLLPSVVKKLKFLWQLLDANVNARSSSRNLSTGNNGPSRITMKASKHIALVLSNLLIPIAVLVFATGFFPYKPFLSGLATFEEVENEELGLGLLDGNHRPESIFDKVIFMTVDALRRWVNATETGQDAR